MKDHPIKPDDYTIHSQEILSLLNILQPFFSGDESEQELYTQIKELLSNLDFDHLHTEHAFLSFLILLFQAIISQIPSNTTIKDQLELLQHHLQPPIDLTTVDLLYRTVQSVAEQLMGMGMLSVEQASMILNPIVMEYATARKQAQVREQAREKERKAQNHQQAILTEPKPSARPVVRRNVLSGLERKATQKVDRVARRVEVNQADILQTENLPQRRILGADRRSKTSTIDTLISGEEQNNYHKLIQGLQKDFVKQTRNAIIQIAEFSEHIELEINTLKSLESADYIFEYKHTVITTLEKLQYRHNKLAANFETARTYLSVIESGSQQLMDELDRVRLLSLTDELTGLPNRRAFLRRLQYEVSRVRRYQHPITLVLVDLDHFKAVNDKYGHDGGDEV